MKPFFAFSYVLLVYNVLFVCVYCMRQVQSSHRVHSDRASVSERSLCACSRGCVSAPC